MHRSGGCSPWAEAHYGEERDALGLAGWRWAGGVAAVHVGEGRARSTVTDELLPSEAEAGTGTAVAAGNGSGAAEHGKIGRIRCGNGGSGSGRRA